MILLDLFSGMGGFAKGFSDAGYQFRKHYFSEVDKHAIANYKYNFKHSTYVGSVKHVRHIIRTVNSDRKPGERLIITFGSPCQDFSLAGKRAGLGGDKSSLIRYALFLIKWLRPDIYIWENVKGAYSSNARADFWAIQQAFADIHGYRREQQLLNTAWLLPQNRERIYLVGHATTGGKVQVFPITEDIGRANERAIETPIVNTITAGGHSGWLHSSMTLIKIVGEIKTSQDGKVFDPNGISQCLSAGHGNVPKILVNSATKEGFENEVVCARVTGRNPDNPKSRKSGLPTEQMLELREDSNTNCLTSVQKDNVIVQRSRGNNKGCEHDVCPTISANSFEHNNHVIQINKSKESGGIQPYMQNRVFDVNGISPCLDGKAGVWNIIDEIRIRRLTEVECERLQGFPDNWTAKGLYPTKKVNQSKMYSMGADDLVALFENVIERPVPASQRYKMCGNAVTATWPKIIAQRLNLNE